MQWSLPASDTYFRPLLDQDVRGFEIDHLEVALSHCERFRTAVDGGAHIGTWSVAMAKSFARVVAFEPATDTYQCLCENIRPLDNVTPYMIALGSSQGFGRVIDDVTRPGNTGARHLGEGNGLGDVPIIPLDDFGLGDVDFLKLDVEGYELQALSGAAATLHNCKPVVLIECKRFKPPRFGVGPEAAAKWLLDFGYSEAARVRNDRVYVHAAG